MADVRETSATDRETAIELWAAAGLSRPWNDPGDDFDRALAGPTSAVLGAFAGDALVGTVMVGHDGHRGWVYYLAVDPAVRRGGVGRRLMAAAERWLQARGVPKLNLMVRHDNAAAVAFYERLGYADGQVTVLGKFLGPGGEGTSPD
ncbi:MAG TPA: GNAT family acetyltransferase [Ilumatobacter sp.]|nr:GNAT family acetyltransferase [Ilumatobacter sp.]